MCMLHTKVYLRPEVLLIYSTFLFRVLFILFSDPLYFEVKHISFKYISSES